MLPLLALAACGAGMGEKGPDVPREYATQTEAPPPDYAFLIRAEPTLDFEALRRGPSGPPPPNARQIGETWRGRLETLDVLDGIGRDRSGPIAAIDSFDLRLTPEEFDAWVAENGWTVPPHLRWSFAPAMILPRVSEAAQGGVRIWPASEQRTGMQLMAAERGTIVLRDGCFYVRPPQGEEKLAWFHTETGLDVDDEGYYVLVNRVTGMVEGRLGELFSWAAPNPITPGGPTMEDFRAACGDGEIVSVANPSSEAKAEAIYPRRPPDAIPPPGIR